MFRKLVAIEPVSLIPSAEEELHAYAEEVVMYSDVPAGDDEIAARRRRCRAPELYLADRTRGAGAVYGRKVHRNVLLAVLSRERERGYTLCP